MEEYKGECGQGGEKAEQENNYFEYRSTMTAIKTFHLSPCKSHRQLQVHEDLNQSHTI